MKICLNGHQMTDDSKFCAICGAQAQTPVQPTAAPVAPTATPVQPTAAPVAPTATPVQPTAAPVAPTAAPVQPGVSPIQAGPAGVAPAQPAQPQAKKKLPVGALIGIIAGGVFLLAIIAVIVVVFVVIGGKKNKLVLKNYEINTPYTASDLTIPDGYAAYSYTFDYYLDTTFLYPESAGTWDNGDSIDVYPSGDYYDEGNKIRVTAHYSDFDGQTYFAEFVNDMEYTSYSITEVGDIQSLTVDGKTLYRLACDATYGGSYIQVIDYVEIYDGYYYEYTVYSPDGLEGTLKGIVESIVMNLDAYYVEPEVADNDYDDDYSYDDSSSNGQFGTGTYTYTFSDNTELWLPGEYLVSEDTSNVSNYEITYSFGSDNGYGYDFVRITCYGRPSDVGYSADELAVALCENARSTWEESGVTVQMSDVQTRDTWDGYTFYCYQLYYEERDYNQYICVVEGAEGYLWAVSSVADYSNVDMQIEILEELTYWSDFK